MLPESTAITSTSPRAAHRATGRAICDHLGKDRAGSVPLICTFPNERPGRLQRSESISHRCRTWSMPKKLGNAVHPRAGGLPSGRMNEKVTIALVGRNQAS